MILAIGGHSGRHRVVPYAARIALAMDGEVIVAHIRSVDGPGEDRDEAHTLVDAEVGRLRSWGVKARGEVSTVREDGIADHLLRLARAHVADLVAIGFHNRSRLGATFTVGTAYRAISLLHCAVLVTRDDATDGGDAIQGPPELRSILVAVDEPSGSEAALEAARLLAGACGAGVTVAHVESLAGALPLGQRPGAGQRTLRQARERLSGAGVEVANAISSDPGPLARRIAEAAARARADLIVIGSSRHPGLSGLAVGSVAHDLPRLTPRPILVAERARS